MGECILITSINGEGDIKSPLASGIGELIGNQEIGNRIFKTTMSRSFLNSFGDWFNARKEYMEGVHPDILTSYATNNVSTVVNKEGEPFLFFATHKQSDLTSLEFLGQIELSTQPYNTNNYPVFVKSRAGLQKTQVNGEEGVLRTVYYTLGSNTILALPYIYTLEEAIKQIPNKSIKQDILTKIAPFIHKNSKDFGGRPHWQVRRSQINSYNQQKGTYIDTLSENLGSLVKLNQKYKDKLGYDILNFVNPIENMKDRTFYVSLNPDIPLYNRSVSIDTAEHNLEEIMQKLSLKIDKKYEFINEEEAFDLTKDTLVPYNGEPALYLNNKLYFIKGKIDLETVLHEFAHPFVSALRVENPSLYNELLDTINRSQDPFIQDIKNYVATNYKEYPNTLKMDEIFVRVLTGIKEGKIKKEEGLVKRFLFYVKQLLRRIFGNNIKVSDLSLNTSLEELSKMLYDGTNNIILSEENEVSPYPLYNRQMAQEIENIDNSKIVGQVQLARLVIKKAVHMMQNPLNYANLTTALNNERSGGTILDSMLIQLNNVQEIEKDINKNFDLALALSRTLEGLAITMDKLAKHSQDIVNNKVFDQQAKAKALIYYSYIVNDWSGYIDTFKREFTRQPELSRVIGQIDKSIKDFQEDFEEVVAEGSIEFFTEVLSELKKVADNTILPNIARLQKLYDNGDKSVLKRLKEAKRNYERVNYTPENVEKYLLGLMGDTSLFSYFLEAATNSPDPIVQGFGQFIAKQFYIVEDEIQRLNRGLATQVDKIIKDHDLGNMPSTTIGERITQVENILGDENKPFAVRTILNSFGNSWRYEFDKREKEIEEIEVSGTEDEIKAKRKEVLDWNRKYFFNPYTDEIYKLKEFWNRDATTQLAYKTRREITRQLSNIYNSTEQETTEEEFEEIKRLTRELFYLSSEYDIEGNSKQPNTSDPRLDINVAKAIKEYYTLSRGIYESIEVKGLFEANLERKENSLIAQGYKETDPEYIEGINNWYKENIQIRVSEEFYDSRKVISQKIDAITQKYPKQFGKGEELGKIWEEIIDLVRGIRDQHNQPIGNQIPESKAVRIRDLILKTEEINKKFNETSKLTSSEQFSLAEMTRRIKDGEVLSDAEKKYFKELSDKDGSLSAGDKSQVLGFFEEMKNLQSKIASEYYLDTMNEKLKQYGLYVDEITYDNVDQFRYMNEVDKLLARSPEFKTWFLNNHITKDVYDRDSNSYETVYERTYIWNRILPNNPDLINDVINNNYSNIYKAGYANIDIDKARQYYNYRIAKENTITGKPQITERIVGKTIDTRGRWLPKSIQDGAAADTPFLSQNYIKLSASQDKQEQGLLKLADLYAKTMIDLQIKNNLRHGALYLELPRLRQQKFELLEDYMDNPVEKTKGLWQMIKDALPFKKNPDDFDRGLSNPDENEIKVFVTTDFLGNEARKIPVKYLSRIEVDKVSLDVGRSILHYAVSLSTAKRMHEVNPVTQMIQAMLDSNNPVQVGKNAYLNKIQSAFKFRVNEKTNIRAEAVKNATERYIYGISHKLELGLFGNKVANSLMKMAAFGSLSFNIPAAIKNDITANTMNFIESVSGKHMNTKDLMQAEGEFMTSFIPKLIQAYNTTGHRGVEVQLFEVFDPIQGRFEEKLGNEYANTYKRDFADASFLMSLQKFGEIQAQGSAMLAMLKHQLVPFTDENGITKMIPYDKAWEVRNGVLETKPGVDKSWARGGKDFLKFKAKIHAVNTRLQGAYANLVRPELDRYTVGKMVLFMRKYFIPGFVQRYSPLRPYIAENEFRVGYIRDAAMVLKDFALSGMQNWDTFTPEEKKNVWKTLTEMAFSLFYMILIAFVFGFKGDDKDKYKKLGQNSYVENMLLYEILMVKSETETFMVPMGLNELLRIKDNPSIAFPLINRYYKLASHIVDLGLQLGSDEDLIHFQRKTGFYDKGDWKLKADLLKLVGATSFQSIGSNEGVIQAIKNYQQATNRYK